MDRDVDRPAAAGMARSPDGARPACHDVAFVTVPAEKIEIGMQKLGALLKAEIAALARPAAA